MAFSGALTLTDLNDFITPSQACIKPVQQTNAPAKQQEEVGAAETEILIDSSGAYYEVSSGDVEQSKSASNNNNKLHQAQISLNDCLACSGCITSAESVLITLQSHTEVLNFLESNALLAGEEKKVPVISIAPQSLASLAASVSYSRGDQEEITPRQILRRVEAFCKGVLGFSHVFDTTFARHLALKEHVAEFVERRKAAAESTGESDEHLPMLASACPGWICYAEKAHAEMLPFISRTKSPQQVMGTLVKKWMGERWERRPDGIYHVTVMPCYDKKLEASRKDFYDEIYSTRDVDCVITTGELELMMQGKEWDLSLGVAGELGGPRRDGYFPELLQHAGSSSGSYLQSIIEHIQRTSGTRLTVSVKTIRNADYEEYTLTEGGGKVVFKGAKCYGFRNLQNIVRKVGKERGVRTGAGAAGRLGGRRLGRRGEGKEENKYEYVEVMACPGGCVNGGGQVKRPRGDEGVSVDGMPSGNWGDKEWTRRVEEAYWREKAVDEMADGVLVSLGAGSLRTEYRAVESDVIGLAVQW